MKNRALKVAVFALILIFIIIFVIYIAIAFYYQRKFMLNTWINGVYCTGKSVEMVNNELLKDNKAPVLTIVGLDGKQDIIHLSDAGYEQDLRSVLYSHMKAQSIFSWPIHVANVQRLQVTPTENWNKELLKELILNSPVVQEVIRSEESIDVKIVLGEDGYELYDGMEHVFNADAFVEHVMMNYSKGILTSDLTSEEFYYIQEDTLEQAKQRELWSYLEGFLNTGFTLDMGAEKYVFDKSIMSRFLVLGEDGAFVDTNGNAAFDIERLTAYLNDLFQKYNTAGTNLMFKTTNGDIVEVPYNTYGTKIDVEAETAYVLNALINHIPETYAPTYIQEGYVKGLDDIGDTYIEVDMTMQKLYCYKNDELIIETDIVTGNMRRGWDTPAGINYVYAKQKKRILRGANYATPVDFWMPVVGNIGLHDADWRSEFGGEIYMTDGSHGCVNIPMDIMPTIYEEFEVGTPVIMFY